MIERTSVNITLHDVDPTALRQLIEYTYSGEITITEDNVQVSSRQNEWKKINFVIYDLPSISNTYSFKYFLKYFIEKSLFLFY